MSPGIYTGRPWSDNSHVASLLLASGSPRRAELLRSAAIEFTVLPVNTDESWREGETPVNYARRVAREKVDAAAASKPGMLILGADTVVWLDPKQPPLGKPRDRRHAHEQLRSLTSGEPHFVTTAYVLRDTSVDPPREHIEDETTRVWMRKLTDEEIETHLDAGEWQDKAGGYGIQAHAAALVTRIKGSYTNVVGLPLAQVVEALRRMQGDGGDA